MRIAALCDVHGNAAALEAVLAEPEVAGADVVVFGGDVAAGPLATETVELLMRLDGARFVRGNADREPDERLSASQRAFLASFEERVVVDGVLFCHGTPRSDEEVVLETTPEERFAEALAGVEEELVVCGHTHMQFDRTVAGIRVVNAGSVGMPYEGRPGAYWALVRPQVDLRRTEYDVGAAAERIRASGWPGAEEFAAENVLASPSREEALAVFEPLVR